MRNDSGVRRTAPGQARHVRRGCRSSGSVASCRIPSSGSPTNMPSTSGTRAIEAAAAVEACGPKQNIGAPYFRLIRAIASTSASSVGVVLGKMMSVGLKPSPSSRAMTSVDRQPLGGRVDQPDVASGIAQQRGRKRERVRRLGRAEYVLALLAAALAREGDAVDERRVDEQRLPPEHLCSDIIGPQSGGSRAAPGAAHRPRKARRAATGDSSTLQQRRHTGKMPFSTRRFRIST